MLINQNKYKCSYVSNLYNLQAYANECSYFLHWIFEIELYEQVFALLRVCFPKFKMKCEKVGGGVLKVLCIMRGFVGSIVITKQTKISLIKISL